MDTDLQIVQQLNGDVRLDDVIEDAPMMKLEFFDTLAKLFSDEEKMSMMEATIECGEDLLVARESAAANKDCDRRAAVAATKAKARC